MVLKAEVAGSNVDDLLILRTINKFFMRLYCQIRFPEKVEILSIMIFIITVMISEVEIAIFYLIISKFKKLFAILKRDLCAIKHVSLSDSDKKN